MLFAEKYGRPNCFVQVFPGMEGGKGMKIAIEADFQA